MNCRCMPGTQHTVLKLKCRLFEGGWSREFSREVLRREPGRRLSTNASSEPFSSRKRATYPFISAMLMLRVSMSERL